MAIGVRTSVLVILPMHVPALLVVLDRAARRARRARRAYSVSNWVQWAAMLVMAFTLTDGGDQGPTGSVLSTWGLMPDDASMAIFVVALLVAIVGFLGALVTAIIGVVVGHRER